MSRASSPRAARKRDWAALRQAIQDEQARIASRDPGLPPTWPDMHDQYQYLHALEKALGGRDAAELLALLDAGVPVSLVLLPVIAEVLRDAKQGRSNGRPVTFTFGECIAIRREFDELTASSHSPVLGILGDRHGVAERTIKRALDRAGDAE